MLGSLWVQGMLIGPCLFARRGFSAYCAERILYNGIEITM